ncbi:ATP-binding protein [Corynebacterium sp.]|uniref:ATP-binding protein n=1 Tax=Corynebacterium sp. TaxID=1720 RepID=UPI0026DC3919|nr:ATP-binding protein [Corynebacterium sp.]MDO5032863.1 ATP-binding protein [Corynebacterium sp.]
MTAQNPFRPTFGAPPLFWVGRSVVLDTFRGALHAQAGTAGRSLVISGARGIGKTVLLNELEDIAETQGWITLRASGRSTMVEELVNTTIPRIIERLSPSDKRRINRLGIGGVGSIGIEHTTEVPFTHNLNTRLRELLSLLRGVGVLLSIDEVQDAHTEDLTTIAVTYQDLVRDELDVAIVAAGLPQGINKLLDLPGVTFLRRAQKFVLGPLSPANAAEAFTATAANSGLQFTGPAVSAAVELSRGYPYLVQLVGSLAWSRAERLGTSHIEAEHVEAISQQAITTLGVQVHQPATTALPPAQREFLEAMSAVITGGVADIADIAAHLQRTVRSLSATRQRLIDADLIEPIAHGQLQFVIPYMERYFTGTDRLGRVD